MYITENKLNRYKYILSLDALYVTQCIALMKLMLKSEKIDRSTGHLKTD